MERFEFGIIKTHTKDEIKVLVFSGDHRQVCLKEDIE
jgi:hypothetical protein